MVVSRRFKVGRSMMLLYDKRESKTIYHTCIILAFLHPKHSFEGNVPFDLNLLAQKSNHGAFEHLQILWI